MKVGTMHDLEIVQEEFAYMFEALHLLESMDFEVGNIFIDCSDIDFIIKFKDRALNYNVPLKYGFELYTAFRALYRLYNEGTDEEDSALQSTALSILYQHLVSVH